jgi:hypothetical protein
MSAFNSSLDCLLSKIKSQEGAVVDDESLAFLDSADESSGVGLYAKKNISKKTVLLEIPYRSCMSVDSIVNSSCGESKFKAIFVDNPGLLDYSDEVLALGLMYAKLHPEDEACDWLEHVNVMPTAFDTTVYWSDEELAEVKNCMVFQLTGLMKGQIQRDYVSIHEPLSQNYPDVFDGMNIHLYTWALTVVYSRALDITRGTKHVRVIVPILDMANHNPNAAEEPSDTLFYDDARDVVQLLSASDLKAGEECFIVYGKYCNAKLLFNYGFALLDNPHRAIDLWTKVSPTTFQAEMKQNLLRQNELTAYQSYDFSGTIR